MRTITCFFTACLILFTSVASGQTFSSGSTGADGALSPTTGGAGCILNKFQNNYWACFVQLPDSGILNYTTVNVPVNVDLVFIPNWRNTPVILLAQGAVTIAGRIYLVSGYNFVTGTTTNFNFLPGPGGFAGANTYPASGLGPGGGAPGVSASAQGGTWVGPLSLVPIIGGSGGGSSGSRMGGGGGGAITIASSLSIAVVGSVVANGATGLFSSSTAGCAGSCGGSGAGGAIRLVANQVTVSGSLSAQSSSGSQTVKGSDGVIRIEVPSTGALSFTGTATPTPVLATTINPTIVPGTRPDLRIVSIGGYPVTSAAGGRNDVVDLLLPKQLPDPIQVVVQASQVPVGTEVKLTVLPATGVTVQSGTLAGTLQTSTATASFYGLGRTNSATYVFAYTVFNLPAGAASLNPAGADRVAQVRMEASPGQPTQYVFLRPDGSTIDPTRLPKALLDQFKPNR